MVMMDSDHRITLSENIVQQLGSSFGNLWAIDVEDQSKLILTALVPLSEEPTEEVTAETKECPVCGLTNPMENTMCNTCGAKF
jgi:hypothetical protein